MNELNTGNVILQPLKTKWLSSGNTEAAILRLDLLHPQVSGNKWFKLKYNISEAIRQQKTTLLTFGGARSNHIAATAAACKLFKLKSIGIIRGDRTEADNPTLSPAAENGMELHFISRADYRKKEDISFLKALQHRFPQALIVPEGGNNLLGFKGTKEILPLCNISGFTHICCPVGTGTTLAGLIATAQPHQEVVGFSALKKTEEQKQRIHTYLTKEASLPRWQINTDYHFGGFARRNAELDRFMNAFQKETGTELDFIYTAKMLFGIKDLVEKNLFQKGSSILIIHTGGLQGNISRIEK